jgi:hypothetical protein
MNTECLTEYSYYFINSTHMMDVLFAYNLWITFHIYLSIMKQMLNTWYQLHVCPFICFIDWTTSTILFHNVISYENVMCQI